MRSVGQRVVVRNSRGGVKVVGWSIDRIRARAQRTAKGASETEARALLPLGSVRIDAGVRGAGDSPEIHVIAEYGKTLDLEGRAREARDPRTRVDLTVYAPLGAELEVATQEGTIDVRDWRGKLNLRSISGAIQVQETQARSLAVSCARCPIALKAIEGDIRALAGAGSIQVIGAKGKVLYFETQTGEQTLEGLDGELTVVSDSGAIHLTRWGGSLQYQIGSSRLRAVGGRGFVSGRSRSGEAWISMDDFRFQDRASFESVSGQIRLELPRDLAVDLDLWSVQGSVELALPSQPWVDPHQFGPEPSSRVRARVGESPVGQIRGYSFSGPIRVVPKS